MADTGKQILDGSSYIAWDNTFSSLSTFKDYADAVKEYRDRLVACKVDLTAVPDKNGQYWYDEYHKEDDINLKAFRDDAGALNTAGKETTAQIDLIRQTEELPESWDDTAGQAALHNYLTNKDRMEQDRDHLIAHASEITQVAENLEKTLTAKANSAGQTVGKLVEALGNNVSDFIRRLRTACEAMEANNQGGSGPFGLGFNQHRYEPHGRGSGGNWSADDVRNDIQTCVIAPFATACKSLDDSNTETEKHLRENYAILLKALDVQGGPPQPISEEALARVMPKLARDPQKLHEYYKMLCDTMRENGIDDPRAQIAFLATLAEESDEFTAPRLEEGWDDRYGPNPPYDARAHYYQVQDGLSGDDWVYHGRGYIQLTTRANYQAAQDYLHQHGYPNLDLMGNPDQASDPKIAAAIAGWFWRNHGGDLSQVAASGDPSTAFTNVTMVVNGAPDGVVVPTAHYDVRANYYNLLVAEYRTMLAAQGVPESALPTTIDTEPRYG